MTSPRSSLGPLLFECRNRALAAMAALAIAGCQSAPVTSAPEKSVEPASPSFLATATAELMLDGVSCASCSVSVRRELKSLDGVGNIREGQSKTHLLIDFDEAQTTPEAIISAVHAAGYEAEVLVRRIKS